MRVGTSSQNVVFHVLENLANLSKSGVFEIEAVHNFSCFNLFTVCIIFYDGIIL